MSKLEEYLTKAAEAYYAGQPFIPDDVFDNLADSIGYNKVGAKQHGHLEKHFKRLYSLDKFYEGEGKRPLAEVAANDLLRTPKLDGAAISILYIDGKLARVLTRGDGIEGTVITSKFVNGCIIPMEINHQGILQVTGEIVAPKYIENARNYAAGSLNLKSVEEFSTRALSFFAYGMFPAKTDNFVSDMYYLESLGFESVMQDNLDKVYDCDGIVMRIKDNKYFESFGYTSKFPKGAYAIKERAEAVETQILAVEWNVGKTGKVTPVAILAPVMIGDAKVSRATLNNVSFIQSLDLSIGDTVGVIRSGEIIPTITYKVDA